MKKIEIERTKRLEDLVERQRITITELGTQLEHHIRKNTMLEGANEALTELIVRLKEGPVQITKDVNMEKSFFDLAFKGEQK